MKFRTNCGNPIDSGIRFCTKCGTTPGVDAQPTTSQASTERASPKPADTIPWQNTPVVPPQKAAAKAKSGCMPAVLVALEVLVLIAAVGMGGLVYAGYKVKQNVTAFLHNAAPNATAPSAQRTANRVDDKSGSPAAKPSGDAAGLLDGLSRMFGNGEDEVDPVESISDTSPVEPCADAPFSSQAAAKVPLREGTVVTTAWGIKSGDVESRVNLDAPTPRSFTQDQVTDAYKDDWGINPQSTDIQDKVCNANLASSNTYTTITWEHIPHLIHGVTRIRLSSKSFEEANRSGQFTLRYADIEPNVNSVKFAYEEGLLTRVEPQDVCYPMIVNDQLVTLPAIHFAGVMTTVGKSPVPKSRRPFHSEAEIYFIDDPANPMVLMWRLKDPLFNGGRFRVEVVKIEYKTLKPINMVEKQLAEQKRAITYGIYFDFNKDTLKPESDPVLKQIVQALYDHPDWKLTVNGHTDNIGGDAYNLDLSKRRAAAVKQSLVNRFHIESDRLNINGYGASGVIDTNETLEGRAQPPRRA